LCKLTILPFCNISVKAICGVCRPRKVWRIFYETCPARRTGRSFIFIFGKSYEPSSGESSIERQNECLSRQIEKLPQKACQISCVGDFFSSPFLLHPTTKILATVIASTKI
jgi:hypothetical protein